MATEYLDKTALSYLLGRLKTYFQKSESGKGLSTNDYTTAEKTKLSEIATRAQVNVIETVNVNGTALKPSSKAVNITVPTNNNQLSNGAGYQTAAQVSSAIASALSGVTSISFQIVNSLPTTGQSGVFYLVAHSHSDSGDSYDEYVWIASSSKFEKIGNTDVDLSGYMKTTDITAITTAEIDTMMSA